VDVPREGGVQVDIVCPIGGEAQFDGEPEIVLQEQTRRHDVGDDGEAEHETLGANEQGSPTEPCQQHQLYECRYGEEIRLQRKADCGEQSDGNRYGRARNRSALQAQDGRGKVRHREQDGSMFALPEAESGSERSDKDECDQPTCRSGAVPAL
jgi:hypothetical protein